LEEEKLNMGAAGKRREDELLAEVAKLRNEVAERVKKIDELQLNLEDRDKQIKDRD
jgi:hypothetical protein